MESGAAVTIANNTINSNQAIADASYGGSGDGGGISVYNSSKPTISGNQILNNSCTLYGGGIALSENSASIITGNTISGNSTTHDGRDQNAAHGGGIYIANASATIRDNSIISNASDMAGGLSLTTNSVVSLIHNQISNNTAFTAGGGLLVDGGAATQATIAQNTFAGNTATYDGSQSYSRGGNIFLGGSTTTLTNNLVRDGKALAAGGVYVGTAPSPRCRTIRSCGIRDTPRAVPAGCGLTARRLRVPSAIRSWP